MTAGRREWTQRQLLEELEPAVAKELDRHLNIAKEWMPHEYVPWTEGMNFAGVFEDGVPWDVTQSKVSETARTALVVNLLTEDNLPTYHRLVYRTFAGGDGAWINWVKRWTAEEGRHAIALRDYLTVTRNIDPVALERSRMRQVQLPELFPFRHQNQRVGILGRLQGRTAVLHLQLRMLLPARAHGNRVVGFDAGSQLQETFSKQ